MPMSSGREQRPSPPRRRASVPRIAFTRAVRTVMRGRSIGCGYTSIVPGDGVGTGDLREQLHRARRAGRRSRSGRCRARSARSPRTAGRAASPTWRCPTARSTPTRAGSRSCSASTSESRAAHDPGDALRRPFAVADQEVVVVSSRSTPSSVVIFSPGVASRTTMPATGEATEVERVQRTAAFEHHVVGDVDDVADRPHARETQPALHPVGRLPHRDRRDPHDEARAAVGRLDDADRAVERRRRRGPASSSVSGERQTEVRGEIARDADDAHRVGTVGRDREVEHDVVEAEHLAHVGAELGVVVEREDARRGRRRGRARARSRACPPTPRRGSCASRS